MIKARSLTTGTVHYAREVHGGRRLMQDCGFKANQIAFIEQVADDVEVTCRRCVAKAPKAEAPKKEAPKTWGSMGWTLRDLREFAKDQAIPGRSKMTGDELFAAIDWKR